MQKYFCLFLLQHAYFLGTEPVGWGHMGEGVLETMMLCPREMISSSVEKLGTESFL